MLTIGSLFSGIGGIELGLERTGHFRTIWQVEIDEYCSRVLEKHWPNVRRYKDVRSISWMDLERPDLVCGGFPCQPVSRAGKRKGKEDANWLWPEMLRCICEIRPEYVLVENVPGLLFANNGAAFGGVLRDLAENRYDAEWDCISAAQFGAPHLRYRVFLLAYPCSERGGPQPFCFQWQRDKTDVGNDGEERLVADADGSGFASPGIRVRQERLGPKPSGFWTSEPCPVGVAHGVPYRVDRLRALGNAVVPQVAEYVGECIYDFHRRRE